MSARCEADALTVMDDWCRKQMAALSERTTPMVMNGVDLDSPEYRRLLGQHQAFHKMRSFIHGCRAHTPKETP